MKKSLYALIFVFVVVILYSVFWWVQSENLKSSAINALTAISQNTNNEHVVTYDELKKGGYPFAFELIFTNPQIATKEGRVIATQKGTLALGTSIFNHQHVWFESTGETLLTPQDGPATTIKGEISFECGNCGLDTNRFGNILSRRAQIELFFSKLLANSHYDLKNVSITQIDESTQQPVEIFAVKEGELTIRSKAEGDHHDFTLDLDLQKASSGLHQFTVPNINFLSEGHNIDREKLKAIVSKLGTYDIKLALHGSVPDLSHPFFEQPSLLTTPSFSLVVDSLEYRSPFDVTTSQAEVSFDHQPNGRLKGFVYSHKKTVFTKEFKPFLIDLIHTGCEAYSKSEKATEANKKFCSLLSKQSDSLVPDFAALSPIVSVLDLTLTGQRGKGDFEVQNATLILKEFKVSAKNYSIELISKLEGDLQTPVKGFVELKIENYKKLINKLVHYYNQWQKIAVASELAKSEEWPLINENAKNLVIDLLTTFSTSQSPNNLHIPVKVEDGGKLTVGTKSQQEAHEIVRKFIIEFQKEIQAK